MHADVLATIYRDQVEETEFGTKFFEWGALPAEDLTVVTILGSQRRICGARFTYRIRPDETNKEFEARINMLAMKFLNGSGTLYIEGEMRFAKHRYTEAALTLHHPPIAAPIEVPKVLRRASAAA